MKKYRLIFAALCCSVTLFAQHKTYSGSYKLAVENTNGTATYSYEEIDDERIKDGVFEFKTTGTYEKISLIGSYKKGEKNGHWKSVLQGRSGSTAFLKMNVRDNRQAFLQPGTKNLLEGNYNNGLKEGKWTFTKSSVEYNYTSTANFKNGKFIGDFIASSSSTLHKRGDGLREYSLKGRFVEGGLPDSIWVGKWMDDSGIEYLIKITFKRGRFVLLKASNLSTGEEISSKYLNYTYISGVYAGKGVQVEWADSLPPIFKEMLGCWLWDETLMKDESVGNPSERLGRYLYLDWDRE